MRVLLFGFTLLVTSVTFANNLGAKTYRVACSNCHAPHLAKAINAPAAFDRKEWHQRFKDAKIAAKANPDKYKSSMDYLIQQVQKGKGLMHHGGLCKEANVKDINCGKDALTAAIDYMRYKQK